MGAVSTWLNGIGLGHAVPYFKAAGIVTPAALAELDVNHYEALGVTKPADRRKLFYLVQRIKIAVERNECKEEEESEEDKEELVASTIETHLVLEDDSDDAPSTRSRRRSSRLSSSQHQPMKTRYSTKTNEQPLKENVVNNSPSKKVKPVTGRSRASVGRRSSAGITVRSSRVTRSSSKSDVFELESKESEGSSDWEEDDDTTTDDAIRNSPRRRSSQRLQSQRQKETTPSTRTTRSSLSGRKSPPAAAATTTSRRQSSDTADTTHRQSSEPLRSSSRNRLSSSDSEEASTTAKKSLSKRASSTPRLRTRRYESKLPSPSASRTGKPLSSIPADSIAPMSPLVVIPQSKLDAAITSQQNKKKPATKARRRSSGGISSSLKRSSSLDGGSSGNESDSRRLSESDSESVSSRRRSSGRQSLGRSGSSSRRRSTSGGGLVKSSSLRSLGSLESSKRRRRSTSAASDNASTSGAVFVHGMPVDDSWASQVLALREDNNAEHELFHSKGSNTVGNSLDEMRIRVVVRKRPMSKSEASSGGEIDVIHPLDYDDYGRVLVYQPRTRVDLTKEVENVPFAFDNVFDESANNIQIYERTVRNLIPGVFEGQWASLFAYGQTGSGKTFTMMGCNLTGIKAGNSRVSDESNFGLYYLAALDVFELANAPEYRHLSVGVSLFEIYGGKLFDLLNDRKPVKCLENHKGKVCFPGLSEHPVTNAPELMEVIEAGAANRSTGSTSKNADSSRSHAVLQLSLRKKVGRKANVEHGRLSFIDLAGSERVADTSKASRSTRLEGAEINTSLLALKEVIRALATGDSMAHIPFRGSKLTQVLKESFVGKNSRSVMVACIAPNISNCEHTLNTLRYANRVKERDAETGHASVDAVCKKTDVTRLPRSFSAPLATRESFANSCDSGSEVTSVNAYSVNDEDGWAEDEAQCPSAEESDDEDSALLDDLLYSASQSPTTTASPTEFLDTHKEASPTKAAAIAGQANRRQVADTLISTHRSVMTEMLGMVKSEMQLVNSTDTDRENIQDYLQELESLQVKQLSLISTLRESLLEYYAARGSKSSQRVEDLGMLSDDSFEDLRD